MEKTDSKENGKYSRGFTLVELIVVVVIIGILAALLVPGMLRYIDQAKEKELLAEARNVYLSAQACLSKDYGEKSGEDLVDGTLTDKNDLIYVKTNILPEAFKMAEVPNGVQGGGYFDANFKIIQINYTNANIIDGKYASLKVTGGRAVWEVIEGSIPDEPMPVMSKTEFG